MDSVVVDEREQYLKLIIRTVPEVLFKGNKKAEDALVHLCMKCFTDGVTFGELGKIEVEL